MIKHVYLGLQLTQGDPELVLEPWEGDLGISGEQRHWFSQGGHHYRGMPL